jgi:hypothetical protein
VDGIIPLDPYFSNVAEAPTLSISCTVGWYFHNIHFFLFFPLSLWEGFTNSEVFKEAVSPIYGE